MKKNEKKLRFSIRKLAVGAASVAIGATLLGVASQNQEVQAADTTATSSTSTTSNQDTLKIEDMTVHMTDAEFAKINDEGFFNENSTNAQIVTDFAKQIQTANPGYEVTAEAAQGQVVVSKNGTTVQTIKVAEYLVNAGTLATTTKFVTPNESEELYVPVKVKRLTSLTTDEFSQVEKLIKSLNSNVESVTQSGAKAIIKFTDGSTKNLSNKALVNEGWISTFNRTGSLNASATTVRVPDEKVVVKDAKNLTDDEKAQVIESLEDANSGLSDKATIKVSDDGYVRVTFNTNQGGFTWLQPSDVITTDTTTKVNGTVKVKKNTRLYTAAGKITKTTVKKNSKWKTTSKKVMNGKTYYRIDSNKMWIPASRVTFTATKKAAVKVTYKSAKNTVTIKDGIDKVSLYDHNLKKVTTTKSGSTFYTTMVRKENGKIVAYRYKTNQWIKVSDIAKVVAGKKTSTKKTSSTKSTSKTTYPAYAATVVLKDDAQDKVSLYDYKLKKVTATLSNVSYIYTTNVKKVNGKIVAYRYKSNQWIKVEDVASVTKGHKKPSTTSSKKTKTSTKKTTSTKTTKKSTTKKTSSTKTPKMTASKETWKVGYKNVQAYLMDGSGKKVKNIAYGKKVKAVAVGTINGQRAWKLSDGNYIYAKYLVPVK